MDVSMESVGRSTPEMPTIGCKSLESPASPKTPAGTKELTGPKTPAGIKTPAGTKEPTGPKTPAGIKTPAGTKEPTGPKTPAGIKTPAGTKEPTGPKTLAGIKGSAGLNSSAGLKNPAGLNSPAGLKTSTDINSPIPLDKGKKRLAIADDGETKKTKVKADAMRAEDVDFLVACLLNNTTGKPIVVDSRAVADVMGISSRTVANKISDFRRKGYNFNLKATVKDSAQKDQLAVASPDVATPSKKFTEGGIDNTTPNNKELKSSIFNTAPTNVEPSSGIDNTAPTNRVHKNGTLGKAVSKKTPTKKMAWITEDDAVAVNDDDDLQLISTKPAKKIELYRESFEETDLKHAARLTQRKIIREKGLKRQEEAKKAMVIEDDDHEA